MKKKMGRAGRENAHWGELKRVRRVLCGGEMAREKSPLAEGCYVGAEYCMCGPRLPASSRL